MSLGFYVDLSSCIGCRTCQVACKDRRDIQVAGPRLRRVDSFECGTYPDVAMFHLNTSCNHCESPACVANCPTGAMIKRDEDGIVYVDESVCIGCGTCANACPYGAPKVSEERGVTSKCNFCMDYLDEGGRPACVDACLMRCLDFGDIAELREKYGDACDVAPLPSSSETRPSLILGLPKNADEDGAVINLEQELL